MSSLSLATITGDMRPLMKLVQTNPFHSRRASLEPDVHSLWTIQQHTAQPLNGNHSKLGKSASVSLINCWMNREKERKWTGWNRGLQSCFLQRPIETTDVIQRKCFFFLPTNATCMMTFLSWEAQYKIQNGTIVWTLLLGNHIDRCYLVLVSFILWVCVCITTTVTIATTGILQLLGTYFLSLFQPKSVPDCRAAFKSSLDKSSPWWRVQSEFF